MLPQPVDAGVPHVERAGGCGLRTVQFFDERHHGGIRHTRARHRPRWPDSPPSTGQCAPAPDGPWCAGRGSPCHLQPVGWLNSCSMIPVASGPHRTHYDRRIPAHHHPAQIEDHRHRLVPSVCCCHGCGRYGCHKRGPERRSLSPATRATTPAPCSTPRASFACIAPPNPLMVMALHSGHAHEHTILSLFSRLPGPHEGRPVVT